MSVVELYAFEAEKIKENLQSELDKLIPQDLQMSESQIHDASTSDKKRLHTDKSS